MAPGLLSKQEPTKANGVRANPSETPDAIVPAKDAVTPRTAAPPSEIVADPGPVSALANGHTNDTNTYTRNNKVMLQFSERVERARDTLVESALYGRLSEVSEAVYERAGTAWSLSKSTAWIVGTSVLVLVLPVLWEIDREASTAEAAAAIAAAGDSSATPTTPTTPAPAASAPATTT